MEGQRFSALPNVLEFKTSSQTAAQRPLEEVFSLNLISLTKKGHIFTLVVHDITLGERGSHIFSQFVKAGTDKNVRKLLTAPSSLAISSASCYTPHTAHFTTAALYYPLRLKYQALTHTSKCSLPLSSLTLKPRCAVKSLHQFRAWLNSFLRSSPS